MSDDLKRLTVGVLKAALKNIPDEYEIIGIDGYAGEELRGAEIYEDIHIDFDEGQVHLNMQEVIWEDDIEDLGL